MCGIVGYVGPDQALPIVMEGLRRLEYRGYDSAGIAVVDGGLSVRKRAGKLAELEALLVDDPAPPATIAIGHTRWATHGAPTEGNAHPHLDCDGRVAVIHNGIIENFQELRERLDKDGHAFASDTDTECVAHLLEEKVEGSASLAEAVQSAVGELEGSYALVVLSSDHPDELVGVKVSSPLVVAMWDDGGAMLASDIPALLGTHHADRPTIVPVDEGWIVSITRDGVAFTDLDGADVRIRPIDVDWNVAEAQKGGYPYFMRKEIDEQPAAIRDTLAGRVHAGGLQLDELRVPDDVLREVSKVFVVACGTAFHSGLVAKYAIEHWTRLPVEIEIASEFRYRDPVLDRDTLVIAISQSGETIDTHEAVPRAGRRHEIARAVSGTGSRHDVAARPASGCR